MPRIFIESKLVFKEWGRQSGIESKHLYLVYEDDDGSQRVIRGGPENNTPYDFGNIAVEANLDIFKSEDSRVDSSTGLALARQIRELDLGGQNPEEVWSKMLYQARAIGDKEINYNMVDDAQNSNSVIASVLNAVGIDVKSQLPPGSKTDDFPGINNLLPTISVRDNDADYTPPSGIPDSGADNPAPPMSFAPTATTNPAPSATQLTNRILESLGGQAGQGIPRSAGGGFALPSASNLARSLLSSQRRTLENSLLSLFTGSTNGELLDRQRLGGGILPGINASDFGGLFAQMIGGMVDQALNRPRTRTTVSETDRSRRMSAGWGPSSSQYAAQMAGWMAQGQRNL